ncbi:MAG: hypothetical protein SFY80_14285 [Verrucomicrobiota bacterium]|nr:hypothetical protein [Verrucomicrobiota bacterium]
MTVKVTDPTTLGENPRKAPGVISFVACNQQGRILYLKGTENSQFGALTTNLIQYGTKLGETLGITGFESMVIGQDGVDAVFIKGADQYSGTLVENK